MYSRTSWEATAGLTLAGARRGPRAVDPAEPRLVGEHDPQGTATGRRCAYLVMPTSNTECFQVFLDCLSRKFARSHILLVLDGAPNHRCRDLVLPDNISLLFLPPLLAGAQPKAKCLARNPREDLQEPCPQIHRRRPRQARAGHPLSRTQPRHRQIHHWIPIHHQVTLIWRRLKFADGIEVAAQSPAPQAQAAA